MFKRIIAMLTALSALSAPIVSVSAAEENSAAAVSGYVSAEFGDISLVKNNGIRPVLYVDDNDYEGVVCAVEALKDDIKNVTGRTADITNNISQYKKIGAGVFSIDSDGMYLSFPSPFEWNGEEAYAAAYNSDGYLIGVTKAEKDLFGEEPVIGNPIAGFKFDTVLQVPDGGTIKGFAWSGMEPVTGVYEPYDADRLDNYDITAVIGTIGKSEVIDSLIEKGRLDVSEIEGKWESFTIQNVDNKLVIAGSDKRGTIYGIYDLCEKMGVSPWSFWADTYVGHADSLYVNLPEGGYTEGEPSVKYRGIFLNDEFNMSEWSKSMGSTGKNMNNATYEKIFELLLRLKANYLWPAMHTYSTAFNVTEGNAALADKYGIVMGSSHAEPILRNNLGELYDYQQEWTAQNPDKKLYINTEDDAKRKVSWMWTDKDNNGSAVSNKEFLSDYWRTRARANSMYENTYTIGMRGVHDGGFTTNMSGQTAMAEILSTQTQILKDEVVKEGQDISDIPQVFIPYKEMLDMYNNGLQIPDYVTLMWPDDNFGYIRQLPTEEERTRSGGAGIYYHLSYYGRPTSYLWLSTTSPALIREEMTKAYDMGAQKIWVANVGDLKPAETEIEYFLDLARDIDNARNADIGEWLKENAERDFGFSADEAAEYVDIKLGYYANAASRRPEHFVNGLFSYGFGDEGQKLIDNYTELENRAQELYDNLTEDKKPSFYELMLYPLKGAKNMAQKYVYADKAKHYFENGYGSAVNKYAKLSDDAYNRVVEDTAQYTSMLNGKWDKMMNPYQTRLTGSFGGTITGKLTHPTVENVPYTNMLIVPEDGGLSFSECSTEPKYIDIINNGSGTFDWTAEVSDYWIRLNKTSGTVADDDRIYLSADASSVVATDIGTKKGTIVFKRVINGFAVDTKTVEVVINASAGKHLVSDEKTYIESDGVVSIEAEHYTNNVANGAYEWRIEKDFGRSGDSVKIYPDTAAAVSEPNTDNSAYLEYNVYFASAGTFPIDVYRMPTLNEVSGGTMRFNIGVDDNTPVRFSPNRAAKDKSDGTDVWGKGVLCNTDVVSGKITIPSAGIHTIRLYNEAPGVVIDKFVITTGENKASYFGAPESYNTTYNSQMKPLPIPSQAAQEQTGNAVAMFQPNAIITGITDTSVSVMKIAENNGMNNILVAAAYDENENMIGTPVCIALSQLGETALNESIDIPCQKPNSAEAVKLQYMVLSSEDDTITKAVPAAPAVNIDLTQNTASLSASYDSGYAYPAADMSAYIGRESVCIISENETNNVKYIRQNTVGEKTYEKIPFNGEGEFKLTINIAGVNDTIEEDLSTIINITPDNPPTDEMVYNQDFAIEPSDGAVAMSGAASYDSGKKAVNMGAGGTMTVELAQPVTTVQGDTVTVVSKIAHGKENGKYMDYTIKNSNGNSIADVHVSAYNGTTSSHWISIGDEKVYENKGSLTTVIDRTKDGTASGYTTYTTVINCSSGEVKMILESAKGTESFTGKLPKGTICDIAALEFKNDYTNSAKACLVKDISVKKSRAASYNITFEPVNAQQQSITDAAVTVTDAVTGNVIENTGGVYVLCEGDYNYTVSADGYNTVSGTLNLSKATESTNVIVVME